MSKRPRRACTLAPAKPCLSEILGSAYDSTDTELYETFKSVCKYYKDSTEAMADFWFTDTSEYDLHNREHQQLLSRIFAQLDLRHPLCKEFLDTLERAQVRSVGVVRHERKKVVGDKIVVTAHYRVRVGQDADSLSDHDYDDYFKSRSYASEFNAS
jgi:hypothetical protein